MWKPRRSARLAKNRVTLGDIGTVDDPGGLPYYMEAIETGYAGPRQSDPTVLSVEEDAATVDMGELQEPMEEEYGADLEEAMEQTMGDYEEPEGQGS